MSTQLLGPVSGYVPPLSPTVRASAPAAHDAPMPDAAGTAYARAAVFPAADRAAIAAGSESRPAAAAPAASDAAEQGHGAAEVRLADRSAAGTTAAPRSTSRTAYAKASARPDAAGTEEAEEENRLERDVEDIEQEAAQERHADETQRERLEQAVRKMNDLVSGAYRSVNYRLSSDPSDPYVEIVDGSTDRVIRTLPPQSMLDRMDRLYTMLGLIFDELG